VRSRYTLGINFNLILGVDFTGFSEMGRTHQTAVLTKKTGPGKINVAAYRDIPRTLRDAAVGLFAPLRFAARAGLWLHRLSGGRD
jgi:hypothetical protein